jgi:hypothetical protein
VLVANERPQQFMRLQGSASVGGNMMSVTCRSPR